MTWISEVDGNLRKTQWGETNRRYLHVKEGRSGEKERGWDIRKIKKKKKNLSESRDGRLTRKHLSSCWLPQWRWSAWLQTAPPSPPSTGCSSTLYWADSPPSSPSPWSRDTQTDGQRKRKSEKDCGTPYQLWIKVTQSLFWTVSIFDNIVIPDLHFLTF